MKTCKLLFAAALLISTVASTAQNKKDSTTEYVVVDHGYQIRTLFGGDHSNGFYIGYDLGFSKVKNAELIETGGRLAWLIGHRMGIGLFGSGILSASELKNNIKGKENGVMLAGGYGGVMLEPILFPKSPIHFSFPVMLGVGGVGYDTYEENIDYDSKTYEYDYTENSYDDAFLVLKPGVELEFNVVRFLRMGVGLQYRYIYGFDINGFNRGEFNGLTANIAFKVGKF